MPKHHAIFESFRRWSGRVPSGFVEDFLGTTYRTAFNAFFDKEPPGERYAAPKYPEFNEEYFEWIDLLEAVSRASGRFVMLELGAGWARWSIKAAAACKQRGIPYYLVAVEAEPTHFEWMLQSLQDNQVNVADCRLVRAAVAGKDGKIGFQVGNPIDYGQAIGGSTEVDAVSLNTLLSPLDYVDLIDLDVQGAEFEVLQPAAKLLSEKVKRVHIETHNDRLHSELIRLFKALGWKPHFLYRRNTADITPWGRINFQEGVQSWLNAGLHSSSELRQIKTLRNTLGWHIFSGITNKYRRDSEDANRRG